MLKFTKGNILKTNAEAIINTVNCVGVMGKGIALQFKQAFPENYLAYKKICDSGELKPGKLYIYDTGSMINPRYIINFPTKNHWKEKSKIDYIKSGLTALKESLGKLKIKSIAIPPLGSGSGGLAWLNVKKIIVGELNKLDDIDIYIFEPQGAPKFDSMPVRTSKPALTRARALLIKLINSYKAPGYILSLLEIQKLAYFLQLAGENLNLEFVKGKYGPYAENLNFLLQRLEGHFLRGYGDRSKDSQIHLLDRANDEADAFLEQDYISHKKLDRVSNLIKGFETPYGMELLATVHWVSSESPSIRDNIGGIVRKVKAWSERKRMRFQAKHIEIAWNRLKQQGWIES